ncbi:hypothetical protein GW891_00260 [bacterium]|nr:hypothetical protein [bacterium]
MYNFDLFQIYLSLIFRESLLISSIEFSHDIDNISDISEIIYLITELNNGCSIFSL